MLLSAADVAVKLLKPLIESKVAVTFAVPSVCAWASPPDVTEITVGEELAQETSMVMSREVLSVYVPLARAWVASPMGNERLSNVTETELITADPTDTLTVALTFPCLAETVAVPNAFARTRPVEPTVTVVGFAETHVT